MSSKQIKKNSSVTFPTLLPSYSFVLSPSISPFVSLILLLLLLHPFNWSNTLISLTPFSFLFSFSSNFLDEKKIRSILLSLLLSKRWRWIRIQREASSRWKESEEELWKRIRNESRTLDRNPSRKNRERVRRWRLRSSFLPFISDEEGGREDKKFWL